MKYLPLLALLLLVPGAPVCAQANCGLKPLKPLVPPECKDLVLQCLCDSAGQNCRWTWICVKR